MNPFGLKTLLKTWNYTLEKMEIFLLKLIKKQLSNGVFISHLKICPLAAEKGLIALPVDRPVDRQRSKIWPLSPPVDRPVDRARSREQLLSCRSTARSTRPKWTVDRPVDRPHPRVGWLQSVDRPNHLAFAHVLCTSIDRSDRSTTGPVDRPGRPPEPGRANSGFKNLSF